MFLNFVRLKTNRIFAILYNTVSLDKLLTFRKIKNIKGHLLFKNLHKKLIIISKNSKIR
jgi:hypothetical protein